VSTRLKALDRARIWSAAESIDGWFYRDAAHTLMDLLVQVIGTTPPDCALVEVGSYQGRSTAVIAGVIRALGGGRTLVAIDPHEGVISESGRPDAKRAPTWDVFQRNLRRLGLLQFVDARRARATDVAWSGPIAFLFLDGLHDAASVRADFDHYAGALAPGGIVAFDDYSPSFPGVVAVVDEILAGPDFVPVARAGDLLAIRRSGQGPVAR
jgi:predicted O-methyltransferase YrrM